MYYFNFKSSLFLTHIPLFLHFFIHLNLKNYENRAIKVKHIHEIFFDPYSIILRTLLNFWSGFNMEVRSFKDAYEWNPPMLWFCSIFSTFILLLFATGDVQLSLYLFLSLSLLSVLAFMVSVLIIFTTKWFKHQK